ncbi:MAG: single-stranded DNA-binding protein [Clostridiales bacterium]|nr:single-stranded DNA-binding protein [Clostridiales bacterium]
MNAVTLIGRLTRDPETRYTSDTQMAVTRFSLAIDRGKDKGADYPSIICFGKTAENCEKYLKKGRMVGIHGRIQTGSYEKDGHKVYTTDIVADRVEFLEKSETTPTAAPEPEYVPDGYEQISEDIPF